MNQDSAQVGRWHKTKWSGSKELGRRVREGSDGYMGTEAKTKRSGEA